MLRIAFLLALLVAAYSLPAHAASRSYVSVMVTDGIGKPISGQEVKAAPVVGEFQTMLVVTTNEKGVAQLGDLADGLWNIETCGQLITTESTDGPTGGLISVTCHRVLLPAVSK